jgi:hypothetical protein
MCHIYVLGVLISVSTIVLFDYGIVPTVWLNELGSCRARVAQ